MNTGIDFSINDDLMITGQIDNLKLTIADFYPYFNTPTTSQAINQKLHLMVPLLQSYLNNLLDKGLKLPIPDNLTKYVKNEIILE